MTKNEKRKKKKNINFSSKLKNNNKGIPIPTYIPKIVVVKHKGDDDNFWALSLENARELCQLDKNLYISEILNGGNNE